MSKQKTLQEKELKAFFNKTKDLKWDKLLDSMTTSQKLILVCTAYVVGQHEKNTDEILSNIDCKLTKEFISVIMYLGKEMIDETLPEDE